MQTLESQSAEWYGKLVANLSDQEKKSLQDVFTLGNQRLAAKQSKSIEQAGGYQFQNQTVPGQFNFASGADPNFHSK